MTASWGCVAGLDRLLENVRVGTLRSAERVSRCDLRDADAGIRGWVSGAGTA